MLNLKKKLKENPSYRLVASKGSPWMDMFFFWNPNKIFIFLEFLPRHDRLSLDLLGFMFFIFYKEFLKILPCEVTFFASRILKNNIKIFKNSYKFLNFGKLWSRYLNFKIFKRECPRISTKITGVLRILWHGKNGFTTAFLTKE